MSATTATPASGAWSGRRHMALQIPMVELGHQQQAEALATATAETEGEHELSGFYLVRPLGAVEEMFAAYAEAGCMTFSIVAELGLTIVRRRHDGRRFFAATAAPTATGNRRRYHRHNIPVAVLRAADASWEDVVAAELAAPFDEGAALFRVTALVREAAEGSAVLVLTFHHSLADGLSGITALRDLLLAMSPDADCMMPGLAAPEPVAGSGWADTVEHRLVGGRDEFAVALAAASSAPPPPPGFFPPPRNAWATKRNQTPAVRSVVVPATDTLRLVGRARREGTTVHAALLAAMSRARYYLGDGQRRGGADPDDGLRIMTPTNTRPLFKTAPWPQQKDSAGVHDDVVGCFIGGAITRSPQPSASSPLSATSSSSSWSSGSSSPLTAASAFWDEARALGRQLGAQRDRDSALGLVVAAELQMRRDASAAAVTDFMRLTTDHEGLLSNLGVLDLGSRPCGAFEVENVWGPALRTCIDGEDIVGASTVGGRLHLVHTALDGTAELLGGMVSEIVAATELQ